MSGTDDAVIQLLRLATPSAAAFKLQKSLGLTYWAYDPEAETFGWVQRSEESDDDFFEAKADIKTILAKYSSEDSGKLLTSISTAIRDGVSKKCRITMQVDTYRPTLFSMLCVKYVIGGKVMVLGLVRNCEKDMQNEMYLLGIRDLLGDFWASSPSGVLLVDNTGIIRAVNQKIADLFEVEEHRKLVGKNIVDQEQTLGTTLVGKIRKVLDGGKQLHGRSEFLRAQGDPVNLNYRLFSFNLRDKFGGIAFAGDRAKEVSPEAVLDSIPNPLVVLDRSSRIVVYANPAAQTSLGIFPEEIGAVRITDRIMSGSDMAEIEEKLADTGREGGRVVNLKAYGDIAGQYLVRANLYQAEPEKQAILEIIPALPLQRAVAKVGAPLERAL